MGGSPPRYEKTWEKRHRPETKNRKAARQVTNVDMAPDPRGTRHQTTARNKKSKVRRVSGYLRSGRKLKGVMQGGTTSTSNNSQIEISKKKKTRILEKEKGKRPSSGVQKGTRGKIRPDGLKKRGAVQDRAPCY